MDIINNVWYVTQGCLQLYNVLYSLLEGEGKMRLFGKDNEFGAQTRHFSYFRLYPCSDCAEDMRADLVESPPRVTSASEFSLWLCQLHNKVNIKLGEFSAFTNIF